MVNGKSAYSLDASRESDTNALARYIDRSVTVRGMHNARLGLKYGTLADECIDIFAPSEEGRAPFVAFFHGGWWKANNRISRAFLAAEYLKRGFGFASIGYPLAPEHSISTIFESARNAISWLHRNASRFGLNPSRILLAGNSAGGHLATMVGAEDSLAAAGLPASSVVGIVSLSGIYDLGLLAGTFVEEWLPLDQEIIRSCSPIHCLPSQSTPLLLAVGDAEPNGFKEQMLSYAYALEKAGRSVISEEAAGHSHFSIIGELSRPRARPFEFSVERLTGERP
ncbi:alpha/beta hydrolase [Mesorhizobium sp. CN2-181]|uniref:alpha/beta hydrolase n=1 Tax=Mesorhizobium yinganensis TaxID=3157707 RepID=UPI0032B7B252